MAEHAYPWTLEHAHPWQQPLVLFDGLHLVCADLERLHEFAAACGLKREWFQDDGVHPHYDVFGRMRQTVMRRGATRASGGTVAMVARRAAGALALGGGWA